MLLGCQGSEVQWIDISQPRSRGRAPFSFPILFILLLQDTIKSGINISDKKRLYEGDLLLTPHEYKDLKTGAHGHKRGFTPGRQWPDGKIPFVVHSSLGRTVNFVTKTKYKPRFFSSARTVCVYFNKVQDSFWTEFNTKSR